MTGPSLRKLFPAALTLLIFLGACTPLPDADPQLAARLQAEADELVFGKSYPAAVQKYRLAIPYDPANSALYLEQGELLETIQRDDEALQTYRLALKRLPAEHPDRDLLRYRAALILARDEATVNRAEKAVAAISDRAMKDDLRGRIALTRGETFDALELFSRALAASDSNDQRARIYYHAARAHHRRGDLVESRNALFHAVNNAESLALKQKISLFFEQLQQER